MAGIYIHIPYCKQACHYCDFHFSTNKSTKNSFLKALESEIKLRKNFLSTPITTIYFGGGTPSLLQKEDLTFIFEVLNTNFDLSNVTEITLEANPDDLSEVYLQEISTYINRLSIGVQSFHTKFLTQSNRAHSADEAKNAIHLARTAGFNNISLDLMFGFPDESIEEFQADLQDILSFSPEHLSVYGLTIEDKTVFGNWVKNNKMKMPDENSASNQYEILMDICAKNGYEQYEISNFCKPTFESKHNSSYWLNEPYLGLGPSAHSFDGENRFYNISNNPIYIQKLLAGELVLETEILNTTNRINDLILTGLRTKWGLSLDSLHQLNYELPKDTLSDFITTGLILEQNNSLTLTSKGRLFADHIAMELFKS